jgi:hypothetical protein
VAFSVNGGLRIRYTLAPQKKERKNDEEKLVVGKFVFGFRARGNGHERGGASLL